ncbi:hypothetical protein MTX35_05915 [Rhodococcus sp. ARC_M12]|uniref:Uncharacterized protein n=1 Tax=Rhodococcus navarretei TaxID=3128981 RepID=A0ABU9CUH5_9NOCA|nr:hypothetical protein [Rhodococcus sp. ARC_M12]MCJ0977234.1 hypothetical protein [Rhodococcus sp. ARC_M12]
MKLRPAVVIDDPNAAFGEIGWRITGNNPPMFGEHGYRRIQELGRPKSA